MTNSPPPFAPSAGGAVLRVGDGRGFIVSAADRRLVVTAAHCLPHFPPCHGASCSAERTYANLLGPLGTARPTASAECLFTDPIADIAVLGSPDNQVFGEGAEAYEALTDDAPTLLIGLAAETGRAWLLSLAGEWQPCKVTHIEDDHPVAINAPLWIDEATAGIHGGMSGSPIINDDGAAIGVVCLGEDHVPTAGGPNPRLTHHLPGWLLRRLAGVVVTEDDAEDNP